MEYQIYYFNPILLNIFKLYSDNNFLWNSKIKFYGILKCFFYSIRINVFNFISNYLLQIKFK